jgi:hypothetical protein
MRLHLSGNGRTSKGGVMKKIIAVLLVAVTAALCTGSCRAAEAPVTVTHEITGYVEGADGVTIEYLLHVTNPGEQPLTDLALTVLPSLHSLKRRMVLNLGTLQPHESAAVPMQVITDRPRSKGAAARQPLFIAGKCLNWEGKVTEFPVASVPGGAQ